MPTMLIPETVTTVEDSMNPVCKKHGIDKEVIHLRARRGYGTFGGYYCPLCRQEQEDAEKTWKAENEYWLKIEESAENLERAICRAQPYDGFEEEHGWFDTNRWFANRLKRYLLA